MADDIPSDVNEEVEAEWVAETTPYERVRTVIKRTYDPQPVRTIAERARTTENTARKHLKNLVADGFVKETADPQRSGAQYRRSNESLILERANRILSEMDGETLAARIAEMQDTVRSHREEFGAASPEDAVLTDAEIPSETLQEWQTTRRNLMFAKVALALSEAERGLQPQRVV
jgi:DNA-binding MarR family transcriptional regulator